MDRRFASARTVLVVLVLLGAVAAQAVALSTPFEAHSAPHHCCLLCHVASLPFLTDAVAPTGVPIEVPVWLSAVHDSPAVSDLLLTAASCRAPPLG